MSQREETRVLGAPHDKPSARAGREITHALRHIFVIKAFYKNTRNSSRPLLVVPGG